ncbi:MAG TPA: hypothetical protein VFD88_14575 [Clostridia bacterium]|nr:hypothetical protein [Clostridia bacterium]
MAASDSPAVVATDGGAVTLIDLATLRVRVDSLRSQADSLTIEGRSLRSLGEGLWIERGKVLLKKAAEWAVPPQLAQLVGQAASLEQNVEADDAKLQSIHDQERRGLGGLVGKVGDWSEGRKASADRAKLDAQMHPLLLQFGHQAPEVTLPEADSLRVQALAADNQAMQLEGQAARITATADLAREEVQRRTDAELEMGFDAPYLAATLHTSGPMAIESPLILKRGEQASLAVEATLARQQTRRQWVGGSQGFSFPIGHTGIRYRVGSFRGHPVEQEQLGKLDGGTLVVTNQRLAFIGSTKSTSVVFAKLLHVECYSDALAVFQEGREKADYYYVAQPKYVLFFINWFLNQPAVTK